MKLVAIILTLNEQVHLARCMASLEGVADSILVVDSFSTDNTVQIAESLGACVVQHSFVTQAVQFNWALSQIDENTDWVLRIDADEYLTPVLITEIQEQLAELDLEVVGVFCGRRMTFQGRLIRFGGVFPIRILRLFRYGCGQSENRWMDEHIAVIGSTVDFKGDLIDDNLNSLTWWTEKHNRYASREVVDMLNREYSFMPLDSIPSKDFGSHAGLKRLIKNHVYTKLPGGFRAFVYFFYRYIFRLGFLDGQVGTAFHFLQGFWYRYLVDAKYAEIKRYLRESNSSVIDAIDKVLGVKVFPDDASRDSHKGDEFPG